MIYQTFIETAVSQAGAGIDPSTFILDEAWLAEDFVSVVFQTVGIDCAKDEQKRSLLRKTKTITFANGVGVVTGDVLTEYKEDSSLYDSSDLSKEYSLIREWGDFIQPRTGSALWLGAYSFNGGAISVVEPQVNYIVAAGLSADRLLNIPCAPTVPASASATIDETEEIIDDLITGLAVALRGRIESKQND